MILGLTDGVTLSDRVEFFKKHRLNRLSAEMEQDCPCFRYITFINIHEVKLVDIWVEEQVVLAFGHLGQLLTSHFEIVLFVKWSVPIASSIVINPLLLLILLTSNLYLIITFLFSIVVMLSEFSEDIFLGYFNLILVLSKLWIKSIICLLEILPPTIHSQIRLKVRWIDI